MFSRFVNRTFYIFVIVTCPSTDECYVYQTFYKHFINVYGLPRKHNMSVLLDAYIGMYVRVHESETQAYCHDDKPYLQATHHTHTHTYLYVKQHNTIETTKRYLVTFQLVYFKTKIEYLLYRRHCGRGSHSIPFSSTCTHAHAIYIRRNVPRIAHPRAFLRRIKHSQAKCTCSTRCIQ